MQTASFILSLTAIGFTFVSFWWSDGRRGKLLGVAPPGWSGYSSRGDMRLRVPVAVANSGPTGIVIADVRAVVSHNDSAAVLTWVTVRRSLKPDPDDVLDFASPLLVSGNSVERFNLEFGGHGSDHLQLAPGAKYAVSIETKHVWARKRWLDSKWRPLISFELEGPEPDTSGSYITYPVLGRTLED